MSTLLLVIIVFLAKSIYMNITTKMKMLGIKIPQLTVVTVIVVIVVIEVNLVIEVIEVIVVIEVIKVIVAITAAAEMENLKFRK